MIITLLLKQNLCCSVKILLQYTFLKSEFWLRLSMVNHVKLCVFSKTYKCLESHNATIWLISVHI